MRELVAIRCVKSLGRTVNQNPHPDHHVILSTNSFKCRCGTKSALFFNSLLGTEIRQQVGNLLRCHLADQQVWHVRLSPRDKLVNLPCRNANHFVPGDLEDNFVITLFHHLVN